MERANCRSAARFTSSSRSDPPPLAGIIAVVWSRRNCVCPSDLAEVDGGEPGNWRKCHLPEKPTISGGRGPTWHSSHRSTSSRRKCQALGLASLIVSDYPAKAQENRDWNVATRLAMLASLDMPELGGHTACEVEL